MVKKIHKEFMEVVENLIKKKIKSKLIQAIILGGSVARGDETEHSDIDIVFYVKKGDMPVNSRKFYKFKGKYIEEHYSEIEKLKVENILPEEKILYDKTGKIIKNNFNDKIAKKKLNTKLKNIKKYQKLAEQAFKNKKYKESFNLLYGSESPAFILMHTLPPMFNLPFPSFRLLKSIKTIDTKYKTKLYKKIEKLYTFDNKKKKQILKDFNKAYILMNKIKKSENPNFENLGFFDKTKIAYNNRELKRIFKDYPFVFAYRFIVGCLTMWTLDEERSEKNKKLFYKILLKILGIKSINKKLIEEKLKISKELLKEVEKLKPFSRI